MSTEPRFHGFRHEREARLCLDLRGQTEDRRLIAELRNDLQAEGQPLRAPVQRQARGRVAGCVEQRRKPDRTVSRRVNLPSIKRAGCLRHPLIQRKTRAYSAT